QPPRRDYGAPGLSGYPNGETARHRDTARPALRIPAYRITCDYTVIPDVRLPTGGVYTGHRARHDLGLGVLGQNREGVGPVEGRLPDPGDALAGTDLFGDLEPEVRQRVIAAAVPRTYRKGQLLFVENDPGESLIVLKRGAVMAFRTAPTGERAVLTVVRPPGHSGELSLLDGGARSLSAEAIEDTQALALSRAAFIELVHANPRILDAVMRSLGALIRRLTEQNADHVFLDLPGRVAKTLVRLAGDSSAPMVTIELNQSQLAEMAGGSRQSVNQAIGSFANRGWLRTEGRRIVVTDLAALRRRAGMNER